ncbi:hypothetical protein ES703_42287 [subsurface metagenome]
MSDGSLSQDEIDALLQETDNLEIDTGAPGGAEVLSDQEKDGLLGLLGGIAASQGSNLSLLTRKSVTLEKPSLELKSGAEIQQGLPEEVVDVKIDFIDELKGEHSYFLDAEPAKVLAGLMLGQEGVELDDAALSAVAEALSQISGTAATEIGNQISRMVKNTPPDFQKVGRDQVRFPQGDTVVKLEYPLIIEGEKPAKLVEVFSLSLVKEIMSLTAGMGSGQAVEGPGPAVQTGMPGAAAQGGMLGGSPEGLPGSSGGMQQTFGQPIESGGFVPSQAAPNVQPVQFANLQASAPAGEQGNIGLLMDVFMEMTVELGRTKKLIRDILGIGEGTIIELDKLAGEPVDILVNHKLIAKGEVVVIDENFGVRVTEIVSPIERMSGLT